MKKSRSFGLVVALSLVVAACGSEGPDATGNPVITLSNSRPTHEEFIEGHGSGFTPRSNVTSHLLRPDGTEYPELSIMTGANGEFVHEIDTLLMDVGTHEWWVIDDTTGRMSNVASFEMIKDQP